LTAPKAQLESDRRGSVATNLRQVRRSGVNVKLGHAEIGCQIFDQLRCEQFRSLCFEGVLEFHRDARQNVECDGFMRWWAWRAARGEGHANELSQPRSYWQTLLRLIDSPFITTNACFALPASLLLRSVAQG
jgi:hypothetical protein